VEIRGDATVYKDKILHLEAVADGQLIPAEYVEWEI